MRLHFFSFQSKEFVVDFQPTVYKTISFLYISLAKVFTKWDLGIKI